MKFPMRNSVQKIQSQTPIFQSQSPICSVKFSPHLHDLIISRHVKHPPINFPKKVCSPMQSFFTKKILQYFEGGEETLCFMFISFPISKSVIPNFCGTDLDLSSKTT